MPSDRDRLDWLIEKGYKVKLFDAPTNRWGIHKRDYCWLGLSSDGPRKAIDKAMKQEK